MPVSAMVCQNDVLQYNNSKNEYDSWFLCNPVSEIDCLRCWILWLLLLLIKTAILRLISLDVPGMIYSPFIHPFIHAFIHPFIYSFIHPFIHASIPSCIHASIHSFIVDLVQSRASEAGEG